MRIRSKALAYGLRCGARAPVLVWEFSAVALRGGGCFGLRLEISMLRGKVLMERRLCGSLWK